MIYLRYPWVSNMFFDLYSLIIFRNSWPSKVFRWILWRSCISSMLSRMPVPFTSRRLKKHRFRLSLISSIRSKKIVPNYTKFILAWSLVPVIFKYKILAKMSQGKPNRCSKFWRRLASVIWYKERYLDSRSLCSANVLKAAAMCLNTASWPTFFLKAAIFASSFCWGGGNWSLCCESQDCTLWSDLTSKSSNYWHFCSF